MADLSRIERDTYWRTLQAFNATRVVIAFVLLLYLSFNNRSGDWVFDQFLYFESCIAYLALALLALLLGSRVQKRFTWQVIAGIAIDILVMSTFYLAAGGTRSGLSILFLFPLAGGAILLPMIPALFLASVVALALLGQSLSEVLRHTEDPGFSFFQSGLAGAAFFGTVLVLNRLARRLVRQERLAAQREASLRSQQAVNRIVMADAGDGILVVDDECRIQVANPAAERMLGLGPDEKPGLKLNAYPWLDPVADAMTLWMADGGGVSASVRPFYVTLKLAEALGPTIAGPSRRDLATHARLRFVPAGLAEGPARTVIFIEDVSEIENRAQQLKLASMGRLTASIAHEVRNPLSAISYAVSLLSEEELPAGQRRLTRIVEENVLRLNRMIEDILKLSRKAQPGTAPVRLSELIPEIVAEFASSDDLRPGMITMGDLPAELVRFDPMHLREVIVNLLSNACRYASHGPGSIRLYGGVTGPGVAELHVEDDGPGIAPEVRAHLFEPFYTTSSKGTGLGLYVARELCLNNGAMLDYEYDPEPARRAGEQHHHGHFIISLATEVGQANAALLDTA